MKKFVSITAIILLIAIFCGVLTACNKEYTMEEKLEARAIQLGKKVIEYYLDSEIYSAANDWEIILYEEYLPTQKETNGIASVWHYTSVCAMTNRLMTLGNEKNQKYFAELNANLWKEMDWYKGTANITSYQSVLVPRTMYAVNRAYEKNSADISGINAVYDDQMWILKEYLNAYNVTGNEDYLAMAEDLTATCLDGWDTSVNPATGKEFGGITWGPGYASKHTCSNAPMVAPLVDLYTLYTQKGNAEKAEYYLSWAKRIYAFSYATFRNANGLFGDLIGTEYTFENGKKRTIFHGTLDVSEYTYNTGTMLQGAAKLYAATGVSDYLVQAQNIAEVAYEVFGAKDAESGLSQYPTTSTAWFNFELLLGFVDLALVDDSQYASVNGTYVDSFRDALNYAYDNYYFNGLLPRNLVKGWVFGTEYDDNKNVMDSACYAEMYALLYQYYTSIK